MKQFDPGTMWSLGYFFWLAIATFGIPDSWERAFINFVRDVCERFF